MILCSVAFCLGHLQNYLFYICKYLILDGTAREDLQDYEAMDHDGTDEPGPQRCMFFKNANTL